MSSGLEHRECAESLGAYALGALPDSESALVREHLRTCRECRADLEWLRAGADTLPASVPQVEPPPELKSRIMQVVEAEAELLRAAGEAADRPPAPLEPGRIRRWLWPTSGWARPGLALAGVGALALVLALVLIGGGTGTQTIQARLTGPAKVAGAQASLRVHDGHAELVVHRFPSPAVGRVYELWVKRGQAAPQPAGTFVVRSGSVRLERPVRAGDLVLATVEPGHGTRAPTTTPFLVAHA